MADEKRVVLLVEDDDVYRESIHRLLDSEYQLLDAATGQQALTLLETHAPECVLLDFRLPDFSGLKLMPKFLERKLPVVMLTAEGSEQVAVEALKAGCLDYLVKRDLTAVLLKRTVFNAIDRNALQRQLEATRRELESFVATAAHDLKAPLRAISTFS
jgi:DNA-binding response OmpR family regulator